MSKSTDTLIKAFGMSGYQIESDIKEISNRYSVELGNSTRRRQIDGYDQFERTVRSEASEMSEYYEIFYCLENSIRKLISDTLTESEGGDWWNSNRIPEKIRTDVSSRKKKELDNGVSVRSDFDIDFTTFGELLVIITSNWDIFDAIFSSQRAVERVLSHLNLLRGPIAHCCPISEDEKARLELTVKDWFRTMS